MPVVKGQEWTFDTVAPIYEKLRPGYPAELYRDLFQAIPLDSSSCAVEIGIGGGQATLPILKTGCQLHAVEYGAHFTELCREKFRSYPNFSAVNCKFEDFESRPDSVDLIYSASAFHWIPEEIGYPKVYEMLKPGGFFARFANHPGMDRGRSGLWDEIQKLYAIYLPNSHPPHPYTELDARELAEVALKYNFEDISWNLYTRTRDFTAQEYPQLLGTYSDHIALPDEVRKEFFAKIEETIRRFGGVLTIYDTLDLEIGKKR